MDCEKIRAACADARKQLEAASRAIENGDSTTAEDALSLAMARIREARAENKRIGGRTGYMGGTGG